MLSTIKRRGLAALNEMRDFIVDEANKSQKGKYNLFAYIINANKLVERIKAEQDEIERFYEFNKEILMNCEFISVDEFDDKIEEGEVPNAKINDINKNLEKWNTFINKYKLIDAFFETMPVSSFTNRAVFEAYIIRRDIILDILNTIRTIFEKYRSQTIFRTLVITIENAITFIVRKFERWEEHIKPRLSVGTPSKVTLLDRHFISTTGIKLQKIKIICDAEKRENVSSIYYDGKDIMVRFVCETDAGKIVKVFPITPIEFASNDEPTQTYKTVMCRNKDCPNTKCTFVHSNELPNFTDRLSIPSPLAIGKIMSILLMEREGIIESNYIFYYRN